MTAWEKTVDVQQHFNDLGLRIRSFAVAMLVAVLSATAVALREAIQIPLAGTDVQLASLLLGAGAIGWFTFYIMDRHWYHRLLVGAVLHGQVLEGMLQPRLGLGDRAGLTQSISNASHYHFDTMKKKIAVHVIAALCLTTFLAGIEWLRAPNAFGFFEKALPIAGIALAMTSLVRLQLLPDWKLRARNKLDFCYATIFVMLVAAAMLVEGAHQ